MVPLNRLFSASFIGCALNAIGSGCATRSAQCVHFEIFGASEFHSDVGTSHGQASWQYRQPMHSSSSYVTGPSASRCSAVVGHAETQAGSKQWRQRCITNADSMPPGFSAFSNSLNAISV